MKTKSISIILGLCFLVCVSAGCESFVRKFSRKSKKEPPKEEMVLAPEEYKGPNMSKEQLYRQYFLYWQSWQDELINALSERKSNKKQIDCAKEAIKNLEQLKPYLSPEKQKLLNNHIDQLKDLKEAIQKDVYGNDLDRTRTKAESLKRNILRDLSYNKIKDYLV